MTATLTPSAPTPSPPVTRRGGRSRETVLFLIGIALIALHVIDDNYLQPPPGTSPGDHVVSGLLPLALLSLAGWAYPRLRGGRRGALALFLGPLGIAAGIEAFYYTREVGPSGDDFTGLLAIAAGLLLLGLGAATLWRTRRTNGSLLWRYPRRVLFGAAGLLVAVAVVVPVALGYVTTHTGRAVVPPNHLGVASENVKFQTSDGLELEGWYVPSRNGAAVIAFPGRTAPRRRRACSPATGTACCCSIVAARATATASPTPGAGAARQTSRPRSPTCSAGRTSIPTASAASASPSAAK
jgi:uncharacterized protein